MIHAFLHIVEVITLSVVLYITYKVTPRTISRLFQRQFGYLFAAVKPGSRCGVCSHFTMSHHPIQGCQYFDEGKFCQCMGEGGE